MLQPLYFFGEQRRSRESVRVESVRSYPPWTQLFPKVTQLQLCRQNSGTELVSFQDLASHKGLPCAHAAAQQRFVSGSLPRPLPTGLTFLAADGRAAVVKGPTQRKPKWSGILSVCTKTVTEGRETASLEERRIRHLPTNFNAKAPNIEINLLLLILNELIKILEPDGTDVATLRWAEPVISVSRNTKFKQNRVKRFNFWGEKPIVFNQKYPLAPWN